MVRIHWHFSSLRFALAALFAAGVAALPIASMAQDAGAGAGDNGAAEEFVEPMDPTPDIGGTGSPGVSTGEKRFDLTTINTNLPSFQKYKSAAERDDLDAAARALSETPLAEEAITPEMVEQVNEELDVRTSLTTGQIAEAVERSLPY